MAAIILKVTPDALKQKAGQFSDVVREIQNEFNRLESVSDKTRGYWRGEAGDRDRAGYRSYQSSITSMIRALEEQPRKLLKLAGLYVETEERVEQVSGQLKSNVI